MVLLKTVLKVEMSCDKCKRMILRAISGIQGIDKIEVDAGKGTIVIFGDADPIEIISRARKTRKRIEVESIGPPPKPQEKKEEKKEEPKPAEKLPPYCRSCEQISVTIWPYKSHSPSCSML